MHKMIVYGCIFTVAYYHFCVILDTNKNTIGFLEGRNTWNEHK